MKKEEARACPWWVKLVQFFWCLSGRHLGRWTYDKNDDEVFECAFCGPVKRSFGDILNDDIRRRDGNRYGP